MAETRASETATNTMTNEKSLLFFILLSSDRLNMRLFSWARRSFDTIKVARGALPGLPFFTKMFQICKNMLSCLHTSFLSERKCLWQYQSLPAHWKSSAPLGIYYVTFAALPD
jgi:hypothetical protein